MADELEHPANPTSAPVASAEHRDPGDEEIGLLEILVVFARHKRLVFAFPFACALIAALISLALHNVYTATARILPPQESGSPLASALLGGLNGLSVGSAAGQALGLRNPSDLYVGMLQSRTIADALIRRFGLQKLYGDQTLVDTRRKLAGLSSITADQNGIISIAVDDQDPNRAAQIANAYVDELAKLTQRVAVTTAGRQRVFLEKQLRKVKDQLSDAEIALRDVQQKTGLISLTEQGKATIQSVAYLEAQIQAKRVQLGAMRTSMTKTNPDYVRAKRELAGLLAQRASVENAKHFGASGVIPSASTLPERALEYVRKLRDMQYQQTLFELIAKQYEIAKSQEAADSGLIQPLDRAVAPDKKSKPHRMLIVLVTGALSGILGILLAFVMEARERALRDPTQAQLLEELRRLSLGR